MQKSTKNDRMAKFSRNAGKSRHHLQQRHVDVGPLVTHEVMRCTKVALRFLKAGTVVRAEIPYAGGAGRKIRPAIVVTVIGDQVELVPCTSSPRARAYSDIAIVDLAEAGLCKTTRAKTGQHVRVGRESVIQVLGHLSEADVANVLVNDHEAA